MKTRDIYNALHAYLQIKKAVGRSQGIKIGNSHLDHQPHLNYPWFSALTLIQETEKSLPQAVKQAEIKLKSLNRQPAVIVDPATKPKNIVSLLKKLGYHFKEDDVWLFYPQNQPAPHSKKLKPKRVISAQQAQIYVSQVHDPVFGDWGDSDLSNWITSYKSGPSEHEYAYMYYVDNQLAATGGIQCWKQYALIYDIAVLPQFRKQGLGSNIFAFLINQAKKLNKSIIFYDTETDSPAESLSLKIGFQRGFQRQLYT